jgi:hypothetical protein
MADPRIIRRHLRNLLMTHRRVKTFVDKHVTHRDRRPMRRLPTYDEIDRCVDVVERLGKDFCFILKAEGTSALPVILGDRKKPFRVPWI